MKSLHPARRHLRRRQAGERGASAVEFAILAPLLIMLLCGMLDFGLMFGGYVGLENGVSSGARDAAVGQYQYTGSAPCSASATDATGLLVCRIASEMGPLMGTTSGSLKIGICFPAQSGTCASSGTRGQDVEVCASVQLKSTTGFTGFATPSNPTVTSSRLVLEQPPSFSTFISGSSVSYSGQTISGITCS